MNAAFIALVRKDLTLYFSNRRAMVMSLVAPIVIAAFFGFLFNGESGKPARIPVAMVNLDSSPLAEKIVAALVGETSLDLRVLPADQAASQLRAGKLRATITLPAGFGEQATHAFFRPEGKPVIDLAYDPSQQMVLPMVHGLLTQHVMQAVSAEVFGGGAAAQRSTREARDEVKKSTALDENSRRDLVALFDAVERVQTNTASGEKSGLDKSGGLMLPFGTHESAMTSGVDRKYNSFAHSFAGMGVQFILMMGIELGMGLLAMRRLGLWQRLRAAPLSKAMLLGSQMASGTLIATTLMLAIFAAAMLLFGVRIEGSMLGFLGVTVSFAVLTATFGLLIAALGKTPEATRGLAILATLLMVMLGGAWVPSFVFPEWLQTVSLAVPTRWAVDGLDGMSWRGLPLAAAWAPMGVMLAFSAVFGFIAVKRFAWTE